MDKFKARLHWRGNFCCDFKRDFAACKLLAIQIAAESHRRQIALEIAAKIAAKIDRLIAMGSSNPQTGFILHIHEYSFNSRRNCWESSIVTIEKKYVSNYFLE